VYKLTPKERSLLLQIAEYRVLLIDQIAMLNNLGKRSVQKKVNTLYKNGILKLSPRNFQIHRGRPENISSLSERGVKLLQIKNLIPHNIPIQKITAEGLYNIEHELLVSWFQIYLAQISQKYSDLASEFLSSKSPFLPLGKNGMAAISDNVRSSGQNIDFIPDGVFSIASKEQNKSLLFFLEVDMGTESVISSRSTTESISQKIHNYKAYYLSKKYERYEKKWGCSFNGFRVLFMTNTTSRRLTLSRFISSDRTNDFIWITGQDQMFQHGVGGKIWTRGGDTSSSPRSILGTRYSTDFQASK
jgi:hypothetical protein